MRCNWRRWLWGIIPLVGLGLAAVHFERGAIEKDLTDRAQMALAEKGAHWAVVEFNGRDVVLRGGATHDREPAEAEAALSQVWGVRHVNNNAGLPPKAEPYVWTARRRGGRLRLHGSVPDRSTQRAIVGMAKAALPGLELVDRTQVARGVPPADTWLAGVSFALKQLAALKQGDVRLEGLAMTISGEAEDATAYKTVSAALKGGLPKGLTLANAQVSAPVVSPFIWSAQFAGGQLVLSGNVANDGAKAKLLAAAETAPSGTGLVDRMEPAGGAPEGWADAAATSIRELVRLQSGSAETKDATVTLGGIAADEAQAKSVRDALRSSLPSSFKLIDQVRVREPKVEIKPPADAPAESKSDPPAPAPAEQQALPAASAPQPSAAEQQAKDAAPLAPQEPEAKVAATAPPAGPQPAEAAPPAAAPPAAAPAPEPTPAAAPSPAPAPEAAAPPPAAPPAAAPAEPPAPVTPASPVAVAAAAPPAPSEAAPKAETASPPPVDLAVCRDDLVKVASGAGPVAFERGSAKIDSAGHDALDRIAAAIKACPGVRIVAEGHADIEGSPEHNQRLSVKRAQAVVDYLTSAGVGPEKIEAVGFGTSRPVAPNTTADARAKNRRAEIIVRPQ